MFEKYLFFMTPMCPNCGEIIEYLETEASDLQGEVVDATTDEGLETAKKYGVMGVPTMLFLDGKGNKVAEATDIDEIRKIKNNQPLTDF